LLVLLFLAACGGGGGASPQLPSQNPPPPPPVPGGPLALTESNVPAATSLAMRSIEHTHVAAESMILTADVLHFRGASSTTIACAGTVLAHLSNTDHDGSGGLSRGDMLRFQFTSCTDLTRDTTMVIDVLDHAAGTIEGRVTFTESTDAGAQTDGTFYLKSAFNHVTLELTQTISEIDVTVASGGTTARVSSAESVRYTADDAYRISLSGHATSPGLGGEFTFATLTPLSGDFAAVPTSGELELKGGASLARISPATDAAFSDDHFAYRIDATGTGPFSAERHGRWSEAVVGLIFCWDSNNRPEITSLSLGPANPTVRDEIVASYTATDFDGDALVYFSGWRVNGNPLFTSDTTLPLDQFRNGDIVTFVLRVSDSRITTVATASTTIVNSPPHNVTASLEPAAPRTTDDLVVRYSAADVDRDDRPEPTFEWLRDGVPIPGQSSQLLPHAAHAKGQQITAVVHVSDGEAVTSATASVTIADTAPVVVAPTTYDAVPYGDTLTFAVTASDVDGDSIGQFVLSYGPAGMTLDPTTGRVSWPVRGPAFDTAVAMSYGVTLDRSNAPIASGTVWLSAPDREKPLLTTGLEAPVRSGIVAGDFDGDGDIGLLVAGEHVVYELEWTGTGLRQSWVYPLPFDQPPAALAAADVDGDGRHEIFIGHGHSLTKLDGVARRPQAMINTGDYETRDLEIADLDHDGNLDVVAIASLHGSADPAAGARVIRFGAKGFGPFLDYPVEQGSAIAIGNVDNDAELEIVTNSGYVFDVFNWLNHWRHPTPFGWEIDVGDLDGNGIDEIVASVDDGSLRAYDGVTHTATWTVANVNTNAVVIADVAGDADKEVVIGDGIGGSGLVKVYAQTAPNAVVLVDASNAVGDDVPAIVTGDIDTDGDVELIFGSSMPEPSLTIAGGTPLAIEWTTADLSYGALLGPYFGGELARQPNGPPVVLFATTRSAVGGARVIGMTVTTGDLTIGSGLGAPSNGNLALTVADYDNDGTHEALLASSSGGTAYHRAYDFFGDNVEWGATFASTLNGVAVAHGNLTGDTRAELVSIDEDGVVRGYEIGTNTLFWTSPMLTNGRDVAIAELNGGGWPEVVVAAADRVRVFSRDGGASYAQTRSNASSLPGLRDIEVGDVDGDGVVEIFALYGLEGAVPPTSVQRLDATLSVQGGFDYWRWARELTLERSSFARKNLVLVETIEGDQIVVVDSDSGHEIWESPTLLGSIARDGVHFIDVGGDGTLRISVATSLGLYLTR
jgi:hypothetical protein